MSWEEDQQWQDFVRHVREDTAQKIAGSAAVISIAPAEGEVDVKFAVELGLSIMLEKPIIILAAPGRPVPEKLRRVADRIVEADLDLEEGRAALQDALVELGVGGS